MREGRVQAWLGRMSDRERSLVVGGGLVLAVLVLVGVALLVHSRVTALEEVVGESAAALAEVQEQAPAYLRNRKDDKEIDELLTRASGTSLQSVLLAVAREVQFERKEGSEGETGTSAKLADFIKFSNANDILAELTSRKGRTPRAAASSKKKKGAAAGKEVFLTSIEVAFEKVPDAALFQFLERVDTHPDGLFATSLDISRESPNHDHFRAKITIGQFRYGSGEEGGS